MPTRRPGNGGSDGDSGGGGGPGAVAPRPIAPRPGAAAKNPGFGAIASEFALKRKSTMPDQLPAEPEPEPEPEPEVAAENGDSFEVVALFSCTAEDDTELTFNKGDTIVVLTTNEDGWWWGHVKGSAEEGFFPGKSLARSLAEPRAARRVFRACVCGGANDGADASRAN